MDHRAVILDGITVQHVGEVFYETGTTAAVRKQCRRTYLRSMEDFTFGFLFGETLSLSGRMPPVGDETPGGNLINRPEMGQPAAIEELLQEERFRSSVEQDMKAVNELLGSELEPFRHFYLREVLAYLGNHASLWESNLDPSTYVFETKDRKSHYVRSPGLQGLVHNSFTRDMTTAIRNGTAAKDVSDDALTEFVTRVLLTHIANYWAFDRAVEDHPHGSARLPHVTRVAIRQKVDAPNPEKHGRLRRLVYKGIVPHALLRVIGVARGKEFFLDALRETRDSKDFTEIRRYLTELVCQLGAGERKDADRLFAEINRKGQGSFQQESFQLSVPVVGGFGVGADLIDRFQRFWNPGKYYLRQLIRDSAYVGGPEYLNRIAGVFPELGE